MGRSYHGDALNRALFPSFSKSCFCISPLKRRLLAFLSYDTTMQSALNSWGSEPLLNVISHNAMDGVDMVRVHFTQESPNAPLNMRLLHYKEYPMPPKSQAKGDATDQGEQDVT
jgi:hypothetical protein